MSSNSTNNISTGTSNTNSTSTINYNPWSEPIRVDVVEYSDRIEMIYKQTSMVTNTVYFNGNTFNHKKEKVFKVVFSCVDGKWNKSEPIYGEIVPAHDEYYKFDGDSDYEF